MIGRFFRALRCYFEVIPTIRQYRLGHYLLVPGLISLALSLLILFLIFLTSESIFSWVDTKVNLSWGWLDATLNWTIAVVTFVLLGFLFVLAHKHLVLILLAPFLGRLAEMTVHGIEGEKFRPRLNFLEAVSRSAKVNLRNIFLELFLTAIFLIIGLVVPLIGSLFATVMIFLTESRYAGFGLMDFPLEYRGFDLQKSIDYTKTRRPEATGLGAGYLLLLTIPILGWTIAPTFSVVAGAILTMRDLSSQET